MTRAVIALTVIVGLPLGVRLPLALAAGAPQNTGLPAITGQATVGAKITVSTGTWVGSPTSFLYEFLECAAVCSPGGSYSVIATQSSNTYTLTVANAGHQIYAAVEATNAAGSAVAVASPIPVVAGGTGKATTTTAPAARSIPSASMTLTAKGGHTLALSAALSAAHHPATRLVAFRWTFGDGKSGSGKHLRHTYPKAGVYTVQLKVTDNLGGSAATARVTSVG